jgi:Mobilization protein NikA
MARYQQSYSGERRTALIAVKLTPSERAELEEAARNEGATVSEHARELMFRRAATAAAMRRNPEAKALADELRAIGINLNQLARYANTMGEIADRADELFEALTELKAATARVISL